MKRGDLSTCKRFGFGWDFYKCDYGLTWGETGKRICQLFKDVVWYWPYFHIFSMTRLLRDYHRTMLSCRLDGLVPENTIYCPAQWKVFLTDLSASFFSVFPVSIPPENEHSIPEDAVYPSCHRYLALKHPICGFRQCVWCLLVDNWSSCCSAVTWYYSTYQYVILRLSGRHTKSPSSNLYPLSQASKLIEYPKSDVSMADKEFAVSAI